ncbi:serine hydrolase domain-containing protein [Adhaeribacter pallidiroseus]|uniref:Serine-type D-Ala-D-Ala carboxypeptidase n=1 Tax=Adhaeribacter pallidiroseus TaxID=2072847 RepID=A0A369Q2K0_9BACT|nr:serine hydrolase domain-containing protein [Adhaeribacter pallidiroseus]RDC58742.1 Serine-type D-Ala-D-Ala carboxypeptidase [Adhaeribacter pallidiroseus]
MAIFPPFPTAINEPMKSLLLPVVSCLLALFLFTFSCQGPANLTTRERPVDKNKPLERYVDSLAQALVDNSQIAGIAIGVMRHDSVLLLKSYGYADLEFAVPMPVNASFEIGSITKQFTAVAIMQLVEKGLLSLDDDISKYLQISFPKEAITVRQLLHHTSGIKEVRLGDILYSHYSRDTVLSLIEKARFDFKPGTEMMYNNKGYFLLGLIIEKLTGQTYEEYLTKNLFLKAGMQNSYLSDQEKVIKLRTHGITM